MSKELGDFQTPPSLVAAVLTSLASDGKKWSRVLEPTCGRGNFIEGLLKLPEPPREIQALCLAFIDSIIFTDAKRPITKKLLQRIDLSALFKLSEKAALIARMKQELEKLGVDTAGKNIVLPPLETVLINCAQHINRANPFESEAGTIKQLSWIN